jgi:hypothetical protein
MFEDGCSLPNRKSFIYVVVLVIIDYGPYTAPVNLTNHIILVIGLNTQYRSPEYTGGAVNVSAAAIYAVLLF